ncbi:MAG TPA: Hsp20/alpha crystallin family protein [Prosthecobacter sp.]|nr:Hsp20/alpha crystallin family protein [Prosthecobacter sp.]
MKHSIRFTRIVSRANQMVAQLQGLQFTAAGLPMTGWLPAVNVYAYADRLEVCVDLAGVKREEVEVEVQSRRLTVRGHRAAPERGCERPPCGRILAMEIPDGDFERIIDFPVDVNTQQTEARQENGWLWIILPKA